MGQIIKSLASVCHSVSLSVKQPRRHGKVGGLSLPSSVAKPPPKKSQSIQRKIC